MRTPRPRPRSTLRAAVLAAAVLLGCWPSSGASAASADQLRLTFNAAADDGGAFSSIDNSGRSKLAVAVVAADGGAVRREHSRTGGSARLPTLDSTPDAPRAVVRVRDRRGTDDLNPGRGAFSFGADFRLDSESEDTSDGSSDNGDNLVQRGLFDATSQYKIQLDHRRATCRVSGPAGAVSVSARQALAAHTWYRVTCERKGTRVTLRLTRYSGGADQTWVRRSTGPTGDLTPDARSVPLSIGGKVAANGHLLASADQLNGRIDNVFVHVG